MQHSEGFVTAVLDRFVSVGHNMMAKDMGLPPWDDLTALQKQQVKQNALPAVLAVLDAAKEVRSKVDVATSWPLLDDEVAEHLVSQHIDDEFGGDGRSEWRWLRTADGDLMLGIFPQGATYELLDAGPASDDFDAALEANRVSYHQIDLED